MSKFTHVPAALAGFAVTLAACWLARRSLKRGALNYWPDTRSPGLSRLETGGTAARQPANMEAM